ncbi:hypothetical protein [Sphingomonas sp. NBWT7]|nr:hypothetical protein [Sphingomonas sp. NBWT7]
MAVDHHAFIGRGKDDIKGEKTKSRDQAGRYCVAAAAVDPAA